MQGVWVWSLVKELDWSYMSQLKILHATTKTYPEGWGGEGGRRGDQDGEHM